MKRRSCNHLQRTYASMPCLPRRAAVSVPDPAAGHCWPTPLPETPKTLTGEDEGTSCYYTIFGKVEISDKMWSPWEGNGKPLQPSFLENPMNSMKRQKDMRLTGELPRSVDVQYATGEEQRNSYRRNEEAEPKRKWHPVVDVSGGECKIPCCKVQYCIGMLGPWINVNWKWSTRPSVNHPKSEREILAINELKWMEICKFNSHDHYIYY